VEETVTSSVFSGTKPKPKRKRMLLMLSVLATAVLLGYLIWQIGCRITPGATLSDDAVRRFHSQLDSGPYDEPLKGSDETFLNTGSFKEQLNFFAGVHSKLGPSFGSTRTDISVTVNTKGTFVKVAYQSTFQKGNTVETFTWRRAADGRLILTAYNVESNVFVSNDASSGSPKNSPKRF
jgi:hypothetical protein